MNRGERNFEPPVENKPEITAEQKRAAVLKFLKKNAVLEEGPEGWVVDVAKIYGKHLPYGQSYLPGDLQISTLDVIEFLSTIKAVPKSEPESNEPPAQKERQIIVLPDNITELQTGEYARRAGEALIQPWQLNKRFVYWDSDIKLSDGQSTNFSEMALAKALFDLKARRNERGELEIYDESSRSYVKFSGRKMKEIAGMIFGGGEQNIYMRPLKFAHERLGHLFELGVLKNSDFRTLADSQTAYLHGEHERGKLSSKQPYIRCSNSDGLPAGYYVGKANLLVGESQGKTGDNKIPLNEVTARSLAPDLVGLIWRGKIAATLALAAGPEMDKVRNQVAVQLRKKGQVPTGTKISQRTTFGKDYAAKHLHEYSVTDYLPPRSNETQTEYFKRVRILDNQEELLKQLKVFDNLGVSVHGLPWGEQLMLCRIALEDKSPQRQEELKAFAKTYGVAGLRTFISMDYDRSLGGQILELGNKLDKPLASAVFEKYGEIVNSAYMAGTYLTEHFISGAVEVKSLSQKLMEGLLKKGKDLLVEFSRASGNSQLESVELLKKLETVNTEVLLFAQAFKILPKEAKVDFAEVANTSLEETDSAELSAEVKKQMLEIFELNRQGNYPEELKRRTLADFEKILNESGHIFRILKHEGRVVAFLHYDQVDKNEIYVGSLNLHPSAKDSPVAVAMLKSALEEKGRNNTLKAVVWANNPARLFYTKILGFNKTGEIPNYDETGEIYWQLERLPSKQEQNMEFKKAA